MSRAITDSLIDLFVDLIKTGASWIVGKGFELIANAIPALGTIAGFFVGLAITYAAEWAIGLYFNKNRVRRMKDSFYDGFQNSEQNLNGVLKSISKCIS